MNDRQDTAHDTQDDPCAEFGPTQRWAVVWFFSVIALGLFMTYRLSNLDRWMYDNNAETFNTESIRENRLAFTSVRSEQSDPRQQGDYFSALGKLERVNED